MFRLPSRALRLILALAFCLQSGLAMAHCARLASPAGGAIQAGQAQLFPMVICTSDGLVTMGMSDPGEDRRDSPGQAMPDLCMACHVLPALDLPAPNEVAAPRLAQVGVMAVSLAAVPPFGARAPPYRPTGPPFHS